MVCISTSETSREYCSISLEFFRTQRSTCEVDSENTLLILVFQKQFGQAPSIRKTHYLLV